MSRIAEDKRFRLVTASCALVAAVLWAGSWVAPFGSTAMPGDGPSIDAALGFAAPLRVDPQDSAAQRIVAIALNRIASDRRGTVLGVLGVAALMTLLALVRELRFAGELPDTLFGVALGAPIGAAGARGRIDTALAAALASPSLHAIALATLFALLPLQLAAAKVLAILVAVFAAVPVAAHPRFIGAAVSAAGLAGLRPDRPAGMPEPAVGEPATRLGGAAAWLLRAWARNVWFLCLRVVPLVILAGFLGAVATTFLPWDEPAQWLPEEGTLPLGLGMAGLAAAGLLLPLPPAFDAVIAASCYAAGMPAEYAAVLLVCLGSARWRWFRIVWRSLSPRATLTLALLLVVLSVATGAGVRLFQEWERPQHRAIFAAFSATDAPLREVASPFVGEPVAALLASLANDALRFESGRLTAPPGIRIERAAFAPRTAAPGPMFERIAGDALGLVRPDSIPMVYELTPPFGRNAPIAAGDVHGDGWVDLLLGTDRGPLLYANRGGRAFALQPIDVPELAGSFAANVALVDLDDDGRLDLFVSTWRGGDFVVFNDGGGFPRANLRVLPATGASLANAAAFGDIDRDGNLDAVLGNWTTGAWGAGSPESSRDVVLWRQNDGWVSQPLPGDPGETQSTLLSDIDGDGDLDLLVGNGRGDSDAFYRGSSGRDLQRVSGSDGAIPPTTIVTSIDSGDIDNDLRFEIYFGRFTGGSPGTRSPTAVCDEHPEGVRRDRCRAFADAHRSLHRADRSRDPGDCAAIQDPDDRADCVAWLFLRRAAWPARDPARCDRFPARWEAFAHLCRSSFLASAVSSAAERDADPRAPDGNVLLAPTSGGGFADRAREWGVEVGGFTGSAKFADLDNDGWQDLYLVNGNLATNRRESDVFYRNRDGRDFEDATAGVGLRSHLAAGSAVVADLDRDGALDVVNVPFEGSVQVFRNRGAVGNAVAFELRDDLGNSHGIGSRVTVYYGKEGALHQVREIKAGGGFLAFDPPGAHFGLAAYEQFDRLEVLWSTGERTKIFGPFEMGYVYRIHRELSDVPRLELSDFLD